MFQCFISRLKKALRLPGWIFAEQFILVLALGMLVGPRMPAAMALPAKNGEIAARNSRCTVVDPTLMRLTYRTDGRFVHDHSNFAWHCDVKPPQFTPVKHAENLVIKTSRMELAWRGGGDGFAPQNRSIQFCDRATKLETWTLGTVQSRNLGRTIGSLDGRNGREMFPNGVVSCDGWYLHGNKPLFITNGPNLWIRPRPAPETAYPYVFGYGQGHQLAALRDLTAIRQLYSVNNPCALAVRWIKTSAPIACQLTVHYDDGITSWGNQRRLLNLSGPCVMLEPASRACVHLHAGRNQIVVETDLIQWSRGFSARMQVPRRIVVAQAAGPPEPGSVASNIAPPLPHGRRIWRIEVKADGTTTSFHTVVGFNTSTATNDFGIWPDRAFLVLKKLGFSSCRTHDGAELDWPSLFPNWRANANLPDSYNFHNSDRILNTMVRLGFTPFVRLGISGYDLKGKPYGKIASNPPDPRKWAVIAEHIVAHDVGGWDHGYHLPIKYIEIWNEPGNPGLNFWSGTPHEFYVLCADALRTIKKAFPKLQVGACGICFPNQPTYTIDLLKYLAAHHAPLDFLSWHIYEGYAGYHSKRGDGVGMFVRWSRRMKAYLRETGYGHSGSICSEWNTTNLPPMKCAAEALNTLMLAQNEGLIGTFLYPLSNSHYWIGPGHDQEWKLKKKAWAFRAFRLLRKITPLRVPARGSVPPHAMVMAARSRHAKCVQILLSDMKSRCNQFKITLSGLRAGTANVIWLPLNAQCNLSPAPGVPQFAYHKSHNTWPISDHNPPLTAGGTFVIPRNGVLRLTHRWKAPEVMLVRVTQN